MSIASENDLIDRLAGALRWYGCGPVDVTADGELVSGGCSAETEEYDERIEYGYGHSGEGWYLFCGEYPDDGSEFIAPGEYGALLVAQAIVAEERAWLHGDAEPAAAGNPEPVGLPAVAPVSFLAELMSLGGAKYLAEDLAARGDTPVLIFTAEIEEVRKTAPIFHKLVRLTAEVGV